MRVLQVSKFYPPVMGGIESVTWELTEGLHKAGVEVSVLCAHQRPRTRQEYTPSGYEVVRASSLGMLLSTSMVPSMPWHLSRMARGADIVHLHMPDPMAAAAVWLARPQGRLVVHWHSDVVRQRIAMKAYEPLQRWLLNRADAVIATSHPYALASRPLCAWGHKVNVIPIGISDNRGLSQGEAVRVIRQRYRGRRIVFSLGRMTYYKGFDVLIAAARYLPDDCVVLVGGEGELLETYRQAIAREGLAGKVHLLGHVNDDELPSYFEACDLFCMPSTVRSEAYGVAILEAMVMGKCIVATDIPGSGVPWVNQHGVTGLNAPVRQPAALAAHIRDLLEDPVRSACLATAARARYEAEFNAELMTRRTLDLYNRLLMAN